VKAAITSSPADAKANLGIDSTAKALAPMTITLRRVNSIILLLNKSLGTGS